MSAVDGGRPQELFDALQLAHSWSSPTTPTPLELYPALAFDRLFKDDNQQNDRCVLDAVLEEARSIRGRISRTDQIKLDEYLNSVREVEQRIERAGEEQQLQGWRPTLSKPNIPRPPMASLTTSPNTCGYVRYPRACIPD